ncbi:hypothetical protein [Rhodococcus wratislaviensis]|uniref:hypothetical protein n=1 Tax=Rhodococcus wratislaviensis TaxID=44752 RepID=UPI00365E574D
MSVSKSPRHHHYCIAVPDLEKAVGDFTRTLQLEFGPAREVTMRLVGHVGETSHVVRFVYSTDGYIKFVETVPGDGLFGDEPSRGFHLVGCHADTDLDEAIAGAVSEGEEVDDKLYVGNVTIAAFFKPTALRPVRIELLSPSIGEVRQ